MSGSAPSIAGIRPPGSALDAAHDPRSRRALLGLLALFLIALAASFLKGQDIFVFAYIMTVTYTVGGPRRHGRPWSEIGIKRGFLADLRSVWYLAGLDSIAFQLLPPTVGLAFVLGYGPRLVDHIGGRLPVDVTSVAGLGALGTLLAVALSSGSSMPGRATSS